VVLSSLNARSSPIFMILRRISGAVNTSCVVFVGTLRRSTSEMKEWVYAD
jgi:hypothetical protein